MADPGKIASQMFNDVARVRAQQPATPAARSSAKASDVFAPASGGARDAPAGARTPSSPNSERFTLRTLSTMAGLLVEALDARPLAGTGAPSAAPGPDAPVGSQATATEPSASVAEGRPLRPGSRIDFKA